MTDFEFDRISKIVETDSLLNKIISETLMVQEEDSDNKDSEDGSALLMNLSSIIESGLDISEENQDVKVDMINKYTPLYKSFLEWLIRDQGSIDSNVIKQIDQWINQIDELLSIQLNEIIHESEFQKLESSWRGLQYLANKTHTGNLLKIKVMSATKEDLEKDMKKQEDFDQSFLYKKLYTFSLGAFGAHPYGAIIGDYEFMNTPMDIELLRHISGIAAVAHAPFISAASPRLFGWKSFTQLNDNIDISEIFSEDDYIDWNDFRSSSDSRYVSLVLPHFLLRLPYGNETNPVKSFNFEEGIDCSDHSKYLWGNAAYALGERITNAFFETGWFARIRGVENGGLVKLPCLHTYKTQKGLNTYTCPTEVIIPANRGREFADNGFIPLIYYQNTKDAVFVSVQTVNKPEKFDEPQVNANAIMSSQMQNILCVSRFSHYLKCIIRDKLGGFTDKDSLQNYLDNWIKQYVLLNKTSDPIKLAEKPLNWKKIIVTDIPGKVGAYNVIIKLKPHFQLEEVTISMRLVSEASE